MENKEPELELFVSCLAGMESLLADELRCLGVRRVRPLSGGAACHCAARAAYRVCLWSRLSARVMLVVGRTDARDAEALYAGVKAMGWEDIVAPGASIAVRATGGNEALRNSRFTALKSKDAVCDRLRELRGARPDVDAESPDVQLEVRVRDDRATVSMDFAGSSLYRRSYLGPDDGDEAPLSCAVAAGLLALAGWREKAQEGWALLDPSCGDGAVVLEAAAVSCDLAPGLVRDRWGFQGWAHHDDALWDELLDEADERFEQGLSATLPGAVDLPANVRPDLQAVRFVGVCTSSPAIGRARERAKRAGLRQLVSFEYGAAEDMPVLVKRVEGAASRAAQDDGEPAPSAGGGAPSDASSDPLSGGHVSADLDDVRAFGFDGEPSAVAAAADVARPGDAARRRVPVVRRCLVAMAQSPRDQAGEAAVQASASAFVTAARAAGPGSAFAAAGCPAAEARFGVAPIPKVVFGRHRVTSGALVFDAPPAETRPILVADNAGGAEHRVEVLEDASAQFASRLHKAFKERRKWAAREGVTCYRVYDADLPDYAVAIDVYEGAGEAAGNTYLHIAEYAPPASVDLAKAARRMSDVLAIAPVALDVRPDHVFSKTRVRESGGSQYRDEGRRSYVTTVEEDGFLLEVDLSGYLDTGLFLDHRPTRRRIEELAAGKSFLNLFGYTGVATVHAAGGGATSTCTVDLSQTYLDWARRNMALNGFAGEAHAFERADVMTWVTECRRSPRRFDLVFVDPPTFSNSKAMGRRTWDVQRDHAELLIGVSRLLTEEGLAVFSCNLRTFKPDVGTLAKYGVEIEDVSASTIPHDFERNPRIHQCYLVRHRLSS